MYYQNKEDDCGIAASRNLLSLTYDSKSYEAAHFPNLMSNFKEIQEGLTNFGVKSKGYEVDEKGLDDVKRPFIAQVKIEDSEHFIVVKKGKKVLTILDSAIGKIRMSKKAFLSISTLKVLEIKDKNEVKEPKIKLMKRKEESKYLLLSLVECLFIIVGLILMTFLSSIYYLLGGFILSILTSFIKRSFILRVNGEIDNRFIIPFFEKDKNDNNYERLIRIKDNYFSSYCSFVNEFEMMLIMIVIASLQDIYLFIGAAIILLLTLISVNFITPYLKRYELNANNLENKMRRAIKNGEKKEMINEFYSKESKISRKYTSIYYLLRIIPCILASLLVIFPAILKNSFVFENLVFGIGYLIILSFNLLKMLRIESSFDIKLSQIADLEFYDSLNIDNSGLLKG